MNREVYFKHETGLATGQSAKTILDYKLHTNDTKMAP